MSSNNKFEFKPIDVDKVKNNSSLLETKENNSIATSLPIKVGVSIDNNLSEKLKDYVYWERTTQQEVILKAIQEFLKDKKIESRPEHLKEGKRRGRRRKYI